MSLTLLLLSNTFTIIYYHSIGIVIMPRHIVITPLMDRDEYNEYKYSQHNTRMAYVIINVIINTTHYHQYHHSLHMQRLLHYYINYQSSLSGH